MNKSDAEVIEKMIFLMTEFKNLIREQQQSLQSQRLLQVALVDCVLDQPAVLARYQVLLDEYQQQTGQALQPVLVSGQSRPPYLRLV